MPITPEDERIAKELEQTPEQVMLFREQWERNPVGRRIIQLREEEAKTELRNTLEVVEPSNLLKIQGQLQGVKTLAAKLLKTDTKPETKKPKR